MNDWRPKMQRAVKHFAAQLTGIRPGTLSPGFMETFRVAYQGSLKPLRHLATIVSRGDRILITPFDRALVPTVVKALVDGRLNAYASDPATVCVTVPPMSGEQRIEMTRHIKALGEDAKVAVRTIRQNARKQIAAVGRGSERAVQEATDTATAEIERLVKAKIASLEQ